MADNAESPPPPVKPFAFLRRPLFIIALLFLAWVFLGQGIVAHRYTKAFAPAASKLQPAEITKEENPPSADVEHRLADVEARLKALESTATTPAKPADDSATQEKIAALQSRLDALQQAHGAESGDAAQVMETLHKQEEDIAALKTQLADTQARALHRLALIAAFNALKDAVMRGESFAEPLKRLNDLAKDDATLQPLLAQLVPYSDDSAPTLILLQSQFEAAIQKALVSDDTNPVTRELQSMIRIRKIGEQQTGNSDEALIARAEAKLNRGDVKASADELATLSPAAAKAFEAWNKKAQTFLQIRDALAALQPALLEDKSPPAAATVTAAPAPDPAVKQ